jgi:hypothetical protein
MKCNDFLGYNFHVHVVVRRVQRSLADIHHVLTLAFFGVAVFLAKDRVSNFHIETYRPIDMLVRLIGKPRKVKKQNKIR